jgi:hypothetical protein
MLSRSVKSFSEISRHSFYVFTTSLPGSPACKSFRLSRSLRTVTFSSSLPCVAPMALERICLHRRIALIPVSKNCAAAAAIPIADAGSTSVAKEVLLLDPFVAVTDEPTPIREVG